jgi:hypothetical protein
MFTDNPKALSGKLLGFVNPNNYFPSAIIIVYKNDNEFFIRYPTCNAVELSKELVEVTLNHHHFFSADEERQINKNEYAFALSREKIIIDTHEKIMSELTDMLSRDTLSQDEAKFIKMFVENCK